VPTKSLRKISFVGLGNIFNAGLGFLFLTAVARTLDLETFGKYALLSTLLLTISKIVDFGANSVYVARSIKEQNAELSSTLFTLKVLQFLVSVPVSLISLKLLNIFDGTTATIFILGILAYTMNYLFYAYFQRAEKYAGMVLLNTIPQLVKGVFALRFFIDYLCRNILIFLFAHREQKVYLQFPGSPQTFQRILTGRRFSNSLRKLGNSQQRNCKNHKRIRRRGHTFPG